MVVGVATVILEVAEPSSIKDKRRVARSVSAKLRNRFNVAVAEVDTLDEWSTLTLAVVCASNDAGHAHEMLTKAVHFLEGARIDAALADFSIELM